MNNLGQSREDILDRALSHIVIDGWSWRALDAAAKDLEMDKCTLNRAFPNGPRDLVIYFNETADEMMLKELNRLDIESMPVRKRISTAVKVRLQQNACYQEALRKLLSYLAMPGNVMLGVKCCYRTVDTIWYMAGDVSTDFNYYSKRGLLAGIYTSTIFYWLADQSDLFEDTWTFLDRRISEVLKIPSFHSALSKRLESLPSPIRIMCSRNLL